MRSSRLYEKQAIDAPEIQNEFILAPLVFNSVQDMLAILQDLLSLGHVSQIEVSPLNYEFRCNIPKEELYKLFPIGVDGSTYYLRHIDEHINTERTRALNSLLLKKIDSKEGVEAIRYRDHIPELEYDQLTVDLLLSCTLVKKAKNIDEDDENEKKSQLQGYRLVNMVLPTYTRTSAKYNYENEKLKARRVAKTPTQITILFPCGFKSENATECMLDYFSLRNHAAQSLIELYYRERFSRMLELIQTIPARASYADPIDIQEDKNTIREIEKQRRRVEDALIKLLNRLGKHQKRLHELHPTIPAALEKEFPYGFLDMDIVRSKLYSKEICTKRVTNKWYPLLLLTIPTPFMGAGLQALPDLILHRPNAKRNLQYAKDIFEYRRLAGHNGQGVIPHVAQSDQEARNDSVTLQYIREQIAKRRKGYKYNSPLNVFDEKALVHFADIDADLTKRIIELKNYLRLIQEIGATVSAAQMRTISVSSNSSSMHHHAASPQSSSSTSTANNSIVPYDASQHGQDPYMRSQQP